MKLLTLQGKLNDLGIVVFTTNDIVKLTNQQKATVNTFLQRHAKQKNLFRIKKGYYSFKELDNKFLLTKAYSDAYIGLHSALEYYQTTTQRFNSLELVSKRSLRDQQFESTKITFHKVKEQFFFGYEKKLVQGVEIFISNMEKTIIDCIYFSDKVYLTEVKEFIEKMKSSIDLKKLELYLKKINSSTLNKRVGYLFELCNIQLNNLKINNKYEKFNKKLNNKGKKNTKWKLIVNEEL